MSEESFAPPSVDDRIQETTTADIAQAVDQEIARDQDINSIQEEMKGEESLQKSNYYSGVKLTQFKDPNSGMVFHIPVNFSPRPIADRILNYLSRTGFVHVLSIGQSGSGKTTLTQGMVHMLHQRKNFAVHNFERDELQNLDKIISKLEKGIDHLIVLDDASFALDELPREKVSEIAKKLTYIRHEVKGNVVLFMNIHYSKGTKKFFRSVPFRFHTSINPEEVQAFQEVYGNYSKYKLKDFSVYYYQMMVKGGWRIETDRYEGKSMFFPTDQPFRLGLSSELNHLHFMLYVKEQCEFCNLHKDHNKEIVDSRQMIDKLYAKYSTDRARAMLRLYSFTQHNIKSIDSKRLSIWHTISEWDKNNNIDWKKVNTELDRDQRKKRPRTYVKTSEKEDHDFKLAHEEAEKDLQNQLDEAQVYMDEQRAKYPKPDAAHDTLDTTGMNMGEGEAYGLEGLDDSVE